MGYQGFRLQLIQGSVGAVTTEGFIRPKHVGLGRALGLGVDGLGLGHQI